MSAQVRLPADAIIALTLDELRGIDARAPAALEGVLVGIATGRLRTPLLPDTALELLELSNRSQISFDEIARRAVVDPTVAMAVMRLGSSVAYSPQGRPQSVKEALVRIGLEGIRHVAYELALSSRIARRGRHLALLTRILRHGRTTSALARILARDVGVHPGTAALTGLLHSAGGLVLVDELAALRQTRMSDTAVLLAVRRLHAWAGRSIVNALGAGTEIGDAIGDHHDARRTPLSRLLCFVDQISPSEPAQRVTPVDVALRHAGLPLSPEQVIHRLQPILCTLEDVRLQMESTLSRPSSPPERAAAARVR